MTMPGTSLLMPTPLTDAIVPTAESVPPHVCSWRHRRSHGLGRWTRLLHLLAHGDERGNLRELDGDEPADEEDERERGDDVAERRSTHGGVAELRRASSTAPIAGAPAVFRWPNGVPSSS